MSDPEYVKITIKELDGRVATSGVSMGGPRTRRKLCPNEVVPVPTDLYEKDRRGKKVRLIDILRATKKVEITEDPITRPFEFDNETDARLTSPTFKASNPSDEDESYHAQMRVNESLAEQFDECAFDESENDDLEGEDDDFDGGETNVTRRPRQRN